MHLVKNETDVDDCSRQFTSCHCLVMTFQPQGEKIRLNFFHFNQMKLIFYSMLRRAFFFFLDYQIIPKTRQSTHCQHSKIFVPSCSGLWQINASSSLGRINKYNHYGHPEISFSCSFLIQLKKGEYDGIKRLIPPNVFETSVRLRTVWFFTSISANLPDVKLNFNCLLLHTLEVFVEIYAF